MADSNLTKQALASALRELMGEVSLEKIQVGQICERCGMNRKSFYYHFKDKYDLVNWIFDTDFISIAEKITGSLPPDVRWVLIERICAYFYENRSFYRKALMVKGQNSLFEHMRECCRPLLKIRIAYLIDEDAADDFTLDFFCDALICAIERWLLDKECIPPDQFVSRAKHLILGGAAAIYQETQKG